MNFPGAYKKKSVYTHFSSSHFNTIALLMRCYAGDVMVYTPPLLSVLLENEDVLLSLLSMCFAFVAHTINILSHVLSRNMLFICLVISFSISALA